MKAMAIFNYPTSCVFCPMCDKEVCRYAQKIVSDPYDLKPTWCPLILLNTERLGEINAMTAEVNHYITQLAVTINKTEALYGKEKE